MSLGYEILFLPEQRVIKFSDSCGEAYRLPDGQELQLKSSPVWCNRCGKVTHGEALPSLPAIDKSISDLERLAGEIRREIDPVGDTFQQEQISECKLRRRWRSLRKSPARCLQCGGTDIVRLEHDKSVRAGSGTIVLKVVAFVDTFSGRSYFTPEGERINDLEVR